jgi:hypothetical protein
MSKAAWKKQTDTAQTEGDPPSLGSTILVIIGWTANSSNAPRKIVAV